MKILAYLLCFAACGKQTANECVTKSSSYVMKYATASGNCGDLPDSVVNVSADGSIPGAKDVTCASQEPDGCTQRNTDCKGPAVNGVTCSATTTLTFAKDGATASGTASITCTGAAVCAGSYSIKATRQ